MIAAAQILISKDIVTDNVSNINIIPVMTLMIKQMYHMLDYSDKITTWRTFLS